MKNNKAHGKGGETWPVGRKYTRDYFEDNKHGKGLETCPDE